MRTAAIVWETVAALACFAVSGSARRITASPHCSSGWFGQNCEFLCHCRRNMCRNNGSCETNYICQSGWFGFECQYVDLAVNASTNEVLTDGNDSTCAASSDTNATVTLGQPYLFTWLRLTFNTPVIHEQVGISLGHNSRTLACNNPRNTSLDNKTLDVYCDVDGLVQVINVSGAMVRHLCSLYVSGGRNVALKQPTKQTSSYSEAINNVNVTFMSSKAVDGNTDPRFNEGQTCSCTTYTATPRWNVTLPENHIVIRYVIYNRNAFMQRLRGFIITSFSTNGAPVFEYQDNSTSPRRVYSIVPAKAVKVAYVEIRLQGRDTLTLCEVEVYGDSVCASAQAGRRCELTCVCASGLPCFPSTHKCSGPCGNGYMGDRCDHACPAGKFGAGCNGACSGHCRPSAHSSRANCSITTGVCQAGCNRGFQGPMCDTACPTGTYGDDCGQTCSDKCLTVGKSKHTRCDPVTGRCEHGCVIGYRNPKCDTACSIGTYGKYCKYTCSKYCVVPRFNNGSVCDFRTGRCLFTCVDNYQGPMCIQESKMRDLGILATFIMPALATGVVLVPLIAFFVISHKKSTEKPLKTSDQQTTDPEKQESAQPVSSDTPATAEIEERAAETEVKDNAVIPEDQPNPERVSVEEPVV